ncbi:MAG: GYF domain-containing protein [Archangium sp.]
MNVSCDKCGKRYVISDDKVAGKASVKIRCKQCQNLIQVTVAQQATASAAGPAPQQPHTSRPSSSGGVVPRQPNPWEEESTRAMPPMDTSAQWFAMLGGKQQGPFGVAELQKRVTAGEVTLRTYLWKAGMTDWKRASDVTELSPIFAGVTMPSQLTNSKPPPPPATTKAPTKSVPAVQRDVALSNEVPAPGLTNRPSAQSGAGAVVASTQQQAPLNDLFGDVSGLNDLPKDLKSQRQEPSLGDFADQKTEGVSGQNEAPVADPFAALSDNDGKEAPPPGEATRFFIAQAGVNKRNPPWKIALAVLGFIGGPILLIYVLNTFEIVKLPTVTRTDENGEEVQESFFSAGGAAGLKDLLTGDAKKRKEEAEKQRLEKEALAKAKALAAANKNPKNNDKPDEPEVVTPKPQDPNLAAFYQNDDRKQVGPKVRKGPDEAGNTGGSVNTSGLSQEAVAKVVADKNKAFQLCIDNALRRTPNLAVGKLDVVLTVGPSGAVKSAALNPKKHEMTDWGQCMMSTGKRIVFPSSDAETQIELPFTVGVAVAP